jgi:nucleoside-diphosphate-sugar epimerase
VSLPRLIVTGSSGFIGRHLLEALKERYEIHGLARRSQTRCGAPVHPNIHWYQVDIGNEAPLRAIFEDIQRAGGAQAVIHLAAHYDFEGEHEEEYFRTNVEGLRNVLENCKRTGVRRFVFSSSLAACSFPPRGGALNEKSRADGVHVYARTKAIGERMLGEYADEIDSVIVRFAALFSDWCEYPPLFMFIRTWLSRAWNNRILGGKGESAIPYMHVRDAVGFREELENGEILIASPDGAVSHEELYYGSTHYHRGNSRMPLHVPRFLVGPGIHLRCLLGKLTGEMPFERPWMARYVDEQMTTDASHTRERLGWSPRPRLHILRRLPFLLENLKSDPVEWNRRNRAAMKQVRLRPNLGIYTLLGQHREEISTRFTQTLHHYVAAGQMPSYGVMESEELRWNHRLVLRNLMNAVRTRERSFFLAYCQDLAERRWEQGFRAQEICGALEALNTICLEVLAEDPAASELIPYLHDHITVTIRFGIDHVLEVYELKEDQRRREIASGPARPAR